MILAELIAATTTLALAKGRALQRPDLVVEESRHDWLATASSLLLGDNVVFVGRVQTNADGTTSFDMNGVQATATVTGTTGLSVSLSGLCAEGNAFQVFLNGALQPKSYFNTSGWKAGTIVKVPLFASGTLAADAANVVTLVKDTEPQFAGTTVAPNAITFHGFSGDSSAARLLAPVPRARAQHKIEFLGDSITAGFDNTCDIPGSPKGFPWSESQIKSWSAGICNLLDGECHYNAWSGFGMVRNCCGCSTLASDVWTRTLATVGSTNKSDPHGTTASNAWNFAKWQAEAVVINLGTNDHLGASTSDTLTTLAFTPPGGGPLKATKCYFDNATGPVTYDGGNLWGDKHVVNYSTSPAACCAMCQQYAGKGCVIWQYDGEPCYGSTGNCCRLKTAAAVRSPTGGGAGSTITSGSIKPLGPPKPPPIDAEFTKRYVELVLAAANAYGKSTGFFLACGPMTSDYCTEVNAVIAKVSAVGVKAYLLDQTLFEDGAYGKKCAYGHPGSAIDAAMAKNGSAFIKTTMGW